MMIAKILPGKTALEEFQQPWNANLRVEAPYTVGMTEMSHVPILRIKDYTASYHDAAIITMK